MPPCLDAVHQLHEQRCSYARQHQQSKPPRTRTYHEVEYAAQSWPRAFRVIHKAEVMTLGENTRFVVTSLNLPNPECVYRDLYCARGQDENYIKDMKNDLACDRTSDHNFLANHLRLYFSCAAYVLHHTLRTQTLRHTELANARPATVMLKLFKLAVRVVQYKDRVRLHLPGQCPVKSLLYKITEILFLVHPPARGDP